MLSGILVPIRSLRLGVGRGVVYCLFPETISLSMCCRVLYLETNTELPQLDLCSLERRSRSNGAESVMPKGRLSDKIVCCI